MEESGENWPYNSDLEISDEAILKDGESESVCEDQIGDPTDNTKENNEKEMLKELSDVMGLKKMDEISIIENARDYVATLQERVRELEQEDGSNICTNKRTKVNSDEYSCGTSDNTLPEVKAKVLQNDVLVIVHCEKQNGILLKILTCLENLHLSVVNSSVLNFGKSILDITIVAKMDDGYNLKVDELVKTMRIAISTQ
ncbi:putative transcription factor bHLH family [Medicago truncatula]|uniref:Basic helix loop helix protein BHLH17, putative n=2 Tax=Medicago truncatula TaxID=3880 RepID=A0A072TYJ3_MEDTR|nr:transcription factor bHLH19 [Medicago truncatula]KEH22497.1 basic helix loop helix protein BHLH17, putative [Medicago truncatula]RHN45630.1 putative transcription factor bHLH family [Medicago truncatula]